IVKQLWPGLDAGPVDYAQQLAAQVHAWITVRSNYRSVTRFGARVGFQQQRLQLGEQRDDAFSLTLVVLSLGRRHANRLGIEVNVAPPQREGFGWAAQSTPAAERK